MRTFAQFLATMTAIVLTTVLPLSAQDQITGRVTDQTNTPIPFADIRLLDSEEALVKGQTTDIDGNYQIVDIPTGQYILTVSMLGFEKFRLGPLNLEKESDTKDLGTVILKASATDLDVVNVVGKTPPVILRPDRLVVNVAAAITLAGSSALEVLERSPGIIVDRQNNNISLSGKSGVVVMINDRISYMPASAVVQLLAGMSADNVEKIEIYTTPPAKFDAEGNAGYINIVLKKSLDDGLNGSYTLSAGYGRGETGNASVNFNYRHKEINLYGDYSYSRNARKQDFSFYRSIVLNGDLYETSTETLRDPLQRNHNARLGIDVALSDKTVFGALLSSYDTKWTMDATNRADITTNGLPQQMIDIQAVELNQWRHYGANFNLQHTFREGETLNLDADLLYYRDNNPTDYVNTYFDGTGTQTQEEKTRSTKGTPIKIGVAKLDYGRQIGQKIKLTAGLKGTLSQFTNDVGVGFWTGQLWENDPNLTAIYKLNEKILAAYGDLDVKLDDKTSAKVGLRYEYTDSNLGAVENEDIVDRQYGRFFPSVFLSREFNQNNSMNLSYSRRITRPTFNDMAPFVLFLDPTTFFSGNPALQPAFSNNFKVDYRYKSALISVQYSQEDSTIASFQSRIIPGTNDQLIFAQNLQGQKTASLTLAIPFSPKPWWNMFFNASGIWQKAGVYYEEILSPIELKSINVFSSQTFTLPKNYTLEVNGFYNSGSLFGAFLVKPFGAVNAGLQKKFNNGSSLRLGIDNIFNSQVMRMSSEIPELQQRFSGRVQFFQRTFKLSYSASFGNSKMKAQRKRATGSEAERQRIGN